VASIGLSNHEAIAAAKAGVEGLALSAGVYVCVYMCVCCVMFLAIAAAKTGDKGLALSAGVYVCVCVCVFACVCACVRI